MPGIFTTNDLELEAIAHTGWGYLPWPKIPANWRELPEPNAFLEMRKSGKPLVPAQRAVLLREARRRYKANKRLGKTRSYARREIRVTAEETRQRKNRNTREWRAKQKNPFNRSARDNERERMAS